MAPTQAHYERDPSAFTRPRLYSPVGRTRAGFAETLSPSLGPSLVKELSLSPRRPAVSPCRAVSPTLASPSSWSIGDSVSPLARAARNSDPFGVLSSGGSVTRSPIAGANSQTESPRMAPATSGITVATRPGRWSLRWGAGIGDGPVVVIEQLIQQREP